ncbi:hypothetical protein [Mesorhizobium sp.]|uniref:hypothetical protein n=2 Tax=Mesorhizobium sp. TaxID=1871066 RepID=UPI000FE7BC0D|nr:hypothetical protein [Mesorhizobium sp.]RWO21613.1 MAG: hypothetical protein EOS09_23170 [Mesorhizobium sp.]
MDRHACGYGYQINVSQLMHSGSGEPYRIAICGGESTEPWPEPTAPVEAGLREKAMDLVGRSYEEAGLRPQPDLEVDITPAAGLGPFGPDDLGSRSGWRNAMPNLLVALDLTSGGAYAMARASNA